jgi:hypothetical protein
MQTKNDNDHATDLTTTSLEEVTGGQTLQQFDQDAAEARQRRGALVKSGGLGQDDYDWFVQREQQRRQQWFGVPAPAKK